MKRIMITFAWTVCVLTACDKNKPSQTGMQAFAYRCSETFGGKCDADQRLSRLFGSGIHCRFGGTSKWNFTIQEFCTWFPSTSGTGIVCYRTDTL